jgi:hypothetical protein
MEQDELRYIIKEVTKTTSDKPVINNNLIFINEQTAKDINSEKFSGFELNAIPIVDPNSWNDPVSFNFM